MNSLPIIDISPLYNTDEAGHLAVAEAIDRACREWGFFYIKGHPISAERIATLTDHAKRFFALPADEKLKIDITRASTTAATVPSPPSSWTRASRATSRKPSTWVSICLPIIPRYWPANRCAGPTVIRCRSKAGPS